MACEYRIALGVLIGYVSFVWAYIVVLLLERGKTFQGTAKQTL